MCYENRFLKSWAKPKAKKREQIKPDLEHARPDAQPIRSESEREITRRKEVAREPEEIV